ncbi:MAG: hypothetical protein HY287_04205 [Planctomycetes bacterium]|nr:hypothetical protein [Planctomycetota bacterium]MBI3833516.1 hypothetical protein [Planctomycetota bacterium]
MDAVSAKANAHSAPGHPFVFWLLLLMGIAAFAPCILLPEWREFQAVRLAEDRQAAKVRGMEEVVDHQRQLLEGLQSDPAVISRIAQRDLHFHHPGDGAVYVRELDSALETVDPRMRAGGDENVTVNSGSESPTDVATFDDSAISIDSDSIEPAPEPRPLDPPRFLQPYLARLPLFNYDAIFCDPQTRPMVMGLSVALIAAAVLIFSRSRRVGLPN